MNFRLRSAAALAAVSVVVTTPVLLGQGSLTPPAGLPGPIYKTLDEVEPRLPLTQLNAPTSGSSVFRITTAGSYYLTADLVLTTGQTGVEVAVTSPVTIDLNGYTIRGAFASVNHVGIEGDGRIRVHNGAFDNVDNALQLGDFASVEQVHFDGTVNAISVGLVSQVKDCQIVNNSGVALRAKRASQITGCFVQNSLGGIRNDADADIGIVVADTNVREVNQFGIQLTGDSTVRDCWVEGTLGTGVSVGRGSVVRGVTALNHAQNGILAGPDSSVIDSKARDNATGIRAEPGGTIRGCDASDNNSTGIFTIGDALVAESTMRGNTFGILATGTGEVQVVKCVAEGNSREGITLPGGAVITDSQANGNGEAGISLSADDCRVERCVANENGESGIIGPNGVTVVDSEASNNGTDSQATNRFGIQLGNFATVTGGVANGNAASGIRVIDSGTIEGCTTNENGVDGIDGRNLTRVIDSTALGNTIFGIDVEERCEVVGCHANGNSSGIAVSDESRVLASGATDNDSFGFIIDTGNLQDCSAERNGSSGFRILVRATLMDCSANQNGADGFNMSVAPSGFAERSVFVGCQASFNVTGFNTPSGADFKDCVATQNSGVGFQSQDSTDLEASNASSYIKCLASLNGDDGFRSTGFSAFEECTARGNGANGFELGPLGSEDFFIGGALVRCVAQENAQQGFASGPFTTYQSCVATRNGLHGFHSEQSSSFVDCIANFNGFVGGNGFGGFLALGGGNLFERCVAINNSTFGIGTNAGTGNVLLGCRAISNTPSNYSITGGAGVNEFNIETNPANVDAGDSYQP